MCVCMGQDHTTRELWEDSALMNSSQPEGERLSKRIMQLRACSRREAEQYIEAGVVRVDGVVVDTPQFRVSTQTVTVDAHASLLNLASVTLIMNKPPGWTDGLEPLPVARPAPAGRKPVPSKGPYNVRSLLTPAQRSTQDASGVKLLKSHLLKLDASVPLEYEASGLVPFTPVAGRDHDYAALREQHLDAQVPCEWMESTAISYTIYTSGTTGKPKGVQRDTGGYTYGRSEGQAARGTNPTYGGTDTDE